MRPINKIVVHHTGSRLGRLDHPHLVKLRHKYLNRWNDIGYHFLIGNGYFGLTGDGHLYEGRRVELPGAHTYRYNEDSLGIALIGNFDSRNPSVLQERRLIKLLVDLSRRFNIEDNDIYGHMELDEKTVCPGKFLDMDGIRNAVWMARNGPRKKPSVKIHQSVS